MLKQLQYELKKAKFSKKYDIIFILIMCFSGIYSFFISQKGVNITDVMNSIVEKFRPFYWILCCYIVCDIVTADYHFKTIKNIIPHSNRSIYIMSKIIVSMILCMSMMMICIGTVNTVSYICAYTKHLNVNLQNNLLLMGLGNIASLMLLISIIMFTMIVSENEIMTIGISIGLILMMFLLDSIPRISMYIPTMWFVSLSSFNNIIFIITGLGIVISIFLLKGTIHIFDRKNFNC